MMPVHCFLLTLKAIKRPSSKNPFSDKRIYYQTLLSVPSDFAIDTMSQDLSNLQ